MNELQVIEFSNHQIDLIKTQIAKGASDDELALFMNQCKRTGLDPFSRQIYLVPRWNSKMGREERQVQVSIDGFRLIAQRSKEYKGQDGPHWCGPDGKWVDVWTKAETPIAARVGVMRTGFEKPLYAVAKFDAYAQRNKDRSLTFMWAKMPDLMIAKCAESLALRKAFPQELGGLYSDSEMEQQDNEPQKKETKQTLKEPKFIEHQMPTPEVVKEKDPKDFPITAVQQKQLAELVKDKGFKPSEMKTYLKDKFNVEKSGELKQWQLETTINDLNGVTQ